MKRSLKIAEGSVGLTLFVGGKPACSFQKLAQLNCLTALTVLLVICVSLLSMHQVLHLHLAPIDSIGSIDGMLFGGWVGL